nr:hypothetical protein [Tanacetum cinerariifolium]
MCYVDYVVGGISTHMVGLRSMIGSLGFLRSGVANHLNLQNPRCCCEDLVVVGSKFDGEFERCSCCGALLLMLTNNGCGGGGCSNSGGGCAKRGGGDGFEEPGGQLSIGEDETGRRVGEELDFFLGGEEGVLSLWCSLLEDSRFT